MIYQNTQKGFSLLLAIIISSVVLAIGLSLLSITMKQLDLSTTAKDSEIAFQAAVAGMECAQSIRWSYGSDLLVGKEVKTAKCGSVDLDLKDDESASNRQNYSAKFDWTPVGEPTRCVNIRLFLINSSATNRTFPSDFSSQGVDGSCPNGVNCTVAVAQGYSTDCDTIKNPNAFAVQRELTAEF